MPSANLAGTSLALSAVVAVVAVLLGVLQWRDHRLRPPIASESDQRYFALRDMRRTAGIMMLALLAFGVYFGSRAPEFVAAPPPAVRGHAPNPVFIAVWLMVFAVLIVLLGLAIADWIATRRYADRLRRAIVQERLELLRDMLEHEANPGDEPKSDLPDDLP